MKRLCAHLKPSPFFQALVIVTFSHENISVYVSKVNVESTEFKLLSWFNIRTGSLHHLFWVVVTRLKLSLLQTTAADIESENLFNASGMLQGRCFKDSLAVLSFRRLSRIFSLDSDTKSSGSIFPTIKNLRLFTAAIKLCVTTSACKLDGIFLWCLHWAILSVLIGWLLWGAEITPEKCLVAKWTC